MIAKIDVNEAMKLGFNEVEDSIYLCGSVIGDYIDGKIHIDTDQDIPYDLRVMIMRKAIEPEGKLSSMVYRMEMAKFFGKEEYQNQ
jgi:hypothetical protein